MNKAKPILDPEALKQLKRNMLRMFRADRKKEWSGHDFAIYFDRDRMECFEALISLYNDGLLDARVEPYQEDLQRPLRRLYRLKAKSL